MPIKYYLKFFKDLTEEDLKCTFQGLIKKGLMESTNKSGEILYKFTKLGKILNLHLNKNLILN